MQQIAADTRISMKMLEAIEEGDGEKLPAPVLIKGFLRAYAQRVGLNPEEVIVEYQDLIEEVGVRQQTIENFHYRRHPKSSKKWFLALFFALGLLAGLALIWSHGGYLYRQPKTPPENKPLSSVEVSQQPAAADAGSVLNEKQLSEEPAKPADKVEAGTDTVDETESSQSSVPKAPVESLPTPFVVRVEALEKTWLHIIVDGGREREYLLQPGEQLTWMATADMEMLVGNAGGIRIFLNDNPLKPLGESGKVVRLHLPDPSLTVEADSPGTESGNRQ